MKNTNKNQVYQKIVSNIFCTDEGREILECDEYTLGKRERQFLLLLTNDDNVSRQLRIGLAPKTSIRMLIEQGFIGCLIDREEILQDLYGCEDHRTTELHINSDKVSPSNEIMVAAGIFM